jgi:hypothetical protein
MTGANAKASLTCFRPCLASRQNLVRRWDNGGGGRILGRLKPGSRWFEGERSHVGDIRG